MAGLGYVAFAADMYGGGQSTTEPAKAKELSSPFYGKPLMAERAQAALDQLLKTGLSIENKVAAIGFCFGGSASLGSRLQWRAASRSRDLSWRIDSSSGESRKD